MVSPDPPFSAQPRPSCHLHTQACDFMDAKPSRSTCKEELAVYGTTLSLSLARHDHEASSNEQTQRRRPRWAAAAAYSNEMWERALNEGSPPPRACEDEAACAGGGSARKKLRLSKEESALLEETFNEHSILTPKHKNELAQKLNLRPRQVEVWFQNRRARTKLKQTELDCELLKKRCESLTEENRRLQIELDRLRALRAGAHPSTMLPWCAQCQCPSARAAAPSSSTTTSNSSLRQACLTSSPARQPSPASSS